MRTSQKHTVLSEISCRKTIVPATLSVLCWVCLIALPLRAKADTKIVGPGGDYATIQAAVSALPNPGPRTVIVRAGTYNELVAIGGRNSAAVSEAQRIVIMADPDAAPGSVIVTAAGLAGNSSTVGHAFTMSQSKFITIKGFKIQGGSREAIYLMGGIGTCSDIVIDSNEINNNGSGSDNGGIAVGRDNVRTWIVNNCIRHNGRNGIQLGAGGSTSSSSPKYIVNNTIFANGWNGIQTPSQEEVFLVNNLIVGNGTATGTTGGRKGISTVNFPIPATKFLVNNMLFANTGGDLDVAGTLDAGDRDNYTTMGAEGAGIAGCTFGNCNNAHSFDEMFVSPVVAPLNFHLRTNSPAATAIDRGTDSLVDRGSEWVPLADFESDGRPSDGDGVDGPKTDIGWDETIPAAPSEPDADLDGIPDAVDCNALVADDHVVDPLNLVPAGFTGGRHSTLQAAVLAAGDDQVISVYADTVENVVIGDSTTSGGKDLRIVGCGHNVTAANSALPVIQVESSAGADDGNTGAGERDIQIENLRVTGASSSEGVAVETTKNPTGTSTLLKLVRSENNNLGITIQGNQNEVRGSEGVRSNGIGGIVVRGNSNTVVDNLVEDNSGHGIDVQGNNCTIGENRVFTSTGEGVDGINLAGSDNMVRKNDVGDTGKGNNDNGIELSGNGNTVQENKVYANVGHGILILGNDSSKPNLLIKNIAGALGKGNVGVGILVSSPGNGTADPVEIDENTAQANGLDGLLVVDAGNELRNNISGGIVGQDNGGCEYFVLPGNFDATNNVANTVVIPGNDGDPFPEFCTGTSP